MACTCFTLSSLAALIVNSPLPHPTSMIFPVRYGSEASYTDCSLGLRLSTV